MKHSGTKASLVRWKAAKMMTTTHQRATLLKVETLLTLTSSRAAKVVQALKMRVSLGKTLRRKTPRRKILKRLISKRKEVTKTLIAKRKELPWRMIDASVNSKRKQCSSISRVM